MVYTLLNALIMHAENPDTFYVPTIEQVRDIAVGDYVKIGFVPVEDSGVELTERMWVKVTGVAVCEGTTDRVNCDFEGTLGNDPFAFAGLMKFGDAVVFNGLNIMDILKEGES